VEEAAREGLKQTPWAQPQAQVVLGSEEFQQRLHGHLHGNEKEQPSLRELCRRSDFAEVVRAVERAKEERWEDFFSRHGDWGRNLV
jgi:hypothetical protein